MLKIKPRMICPTHTRLSALICFGVATWCQASLLATEPAATEKAGVANRPANPLVLQVRRQVVAGSLQRGGFYYGKEQQIEIDLAKTAVVTVDVWNGHSSTEFTRRIDRLVPRLNDAVVAARKLGMVVIHGPTVENLHENAKAVFPNEPEKHGFYVDSPQRKAALALKHSPLPELKQVWKEYAVMPYAKHPRVVDGTWVTNDSPKWRMHPALIVEKDDYIIDSLQELWNVCQTHGIENLIYCGFASNMCLVAKPWAIGGGKSLGLNCYVMRDLIDPITPLDENLKVKEERPWETAEYVHGKVVRHIETHFAPTFESRQLLVATGMAVKEPVKQPMKRIFTDEQVAAYKPVGASNCYRHFTLDWNWQSGYIDDYFLRADPVEIAEFAERCNINGLVIMNMPHQGYVTYPSDLAPQFPAIAGRDWYGEVVRECHKRDIAVLGYNSLARNIWYGTEHPEQTWQRGAERWVDLNTPYMDYLVKLSQEVLLREPVDGLRYDTLHQDYNPRNRWSQTWYQKLYGEPLPETWDKTNWRRRCDFKRWSTSRAARMLYEGNKAIKPEIEVWQNGFIQQKDFDSNDLEAGRYQDVGYIEAGDPFRQLLLTGVLRLKGTIVGHLFNMPRSTQRLCMALGARGYQYKAVNRETALPDDREWYYRNVAPFYAMIKRIQPYLEGAKPVPYVGVVYGEATRYRTYDYDRDWYVYGILKPLAMSYLGQSRIVEFICSLDLATDDFSHLPVIVLPETSGLRPAELDGLRRYVQEGGQLLITGEALRYDEKGSPRSDFSLAREMGVSVGGEKASRWLWCNSASKPGQRVTLRVDKEGPATFRLWMREARARVDQIVLTRDADYHPTGPVSAKDSADKIVFEAEHFDKMVPRSNRAWKLRRDPPGCGGEGSIRAEIHVAPTIEGATHDETPNGRIDDVTESPEAQYTVQFPEAGIYYVWVRQVHESDSDDSVFVGLEPKKPTAMFFGSSVASPVESNRLAIVDDSTLKVDWPQNINAKGMMRVRATAGSTVSKITIDGQALPLLHVNRLGKGRIAYLATSRDIGLLRQVIDAMSGAVPVRPEPADKQVIFTRQEKQNRWVLHLLSDGDYSIQIDKHSAAPTKIVEQYPAEGWSATIQPTDSGVRITASGKAVDRLLLLE